MWKLNNIEFKSAESDVSFSDGLDLLTLRGGQGICFRLLVHNHGYLDIIDTGQQPGGPFESQLIISDQLYWYSGTGSFSISVNPNGSFELSGDNNLVFGRLIPFPEIQEKDVKNLTWMMQHNYVPYHSHTSSTDILESELREKGRQFFPFSPYSFQLAMAVYDWTTPNFMRMEYLRAFQYSTAPKKLDTKSLSRYIWNSSLFTDTKELANSFPIEPVSSIMEFEHQLNQKENHLVQLNDSEIDLLLAALAVLPPTTYMDQPVLYVTSTEFGFPPSEYLGALFEESPANQQGDAELPMPLEEALSTFIEEGKTLTIKGIIACTDSMDKALTQAGDVLLSITPPVNSVVWNDVKNITSMSSQKNENRFVVKAGTRFQVEQIIRTQLFGKELTKIELRIL